VTTISNLVRSEIKCSAAKKHKILTRNTKPHRSNQKQQYLLVKY